MAEVVIDLIGKDNASGSIRSTESALGGLKNALVACGVAAAAYKAIDYLKDSAMLAAQVGMQEVALRHVGAQAGYTRKELDGYTKALEDQGITTRESINNLTRMAQSHLDLAAASKLARVAQDAAVISNENSSQTFEALLHGITTLQPEVLRQHGIIVDLEKAYSAFAATSGRAAKDLTQQEKQQIALNAVLDQGKVIAGTYEEAMGTVGKQITSMPRYIEETSLAIGKGLMPVLSESMFVFKDFVTAIGKNDDALKGIGKTVILVGIGVATFAQGFAMAGQGLLLTAGLIVKAFDEEKGNSILRMGNQVGEFAKQIGNASSSLMVAFSDLDNYTSKANDSAAASDAIARKAREAADAMKAESVSIDTASASNIELAATSAAVNDKLATTITNLQGVSSAVVEANGYWAQYIDEVSGITVRVRAETLPDYKAPAASGGGGSSYSTGTSAPWTAGPQMPSFDIGIDRVPQDMPAFIHRNEAVLKPADAENWRKGKAGGTEVHIHAQVITEASIGPLARMLQQAMEDNFFHARA